MLKNGKTWSIDTVDSYTFPNLSLIHLMVSRKHVFTDDTRRTTDARDPALILRAQSNRANNNNNNNNNNNHNNNNNFNVFPGPVPFILPSLKEECWY